MYPTSRNRRPSSNPELSPLSAPRRPVALDVGRERIATHRELTAAGMAMSTITYRIRPDGRWQRLLPGVVAMHSGRPTTRERLLGALAYAGPDAVLTGMAALRLHGLRTATAGTVQVLVPHGLHRQNHSYVVVERTRHMPAPQDVRAVTGLPTAPLARAVVDACRRLEDLNDVRNLVADAVQNHGLAITALAVEVRRAARQRTALGRRVLAEIEVGVRFAAEARARELIRQHGLPEPLFNCELVDADGNVIVTPDGYFPKWVCGYQIDSRRWHLSPDDYEWTTALRAYALRFRVILVPVTPTRVFTQPTGFVADLLGAIDTAKNRTPPTIAHRRRTQG